MVDGLREITSLMSKPGYAGVTQNVHKIPCQFPDRVYARRLTAKQSYGTKCCGLFEARCNLKRILAA
jgi:hypothetical protein